MDVTNFSFKYLKNGQPQGFRSKKGSFDGQTVTLDDTQFPVAIIQAIETRQNYIFFVLPSESGEHVTLPIILTSGSAKQLKMALDRSRSGIWAQLRQEKLNEQGRGDEFRAVNCPHCAAVIDLSGMPQTPQVYCRFCDSLLTDPAYGVGAANEASFCICDQCKMFSAPKKYTLFYFYFLLVVYGWYSKPTWCCPLCFRPQAWKMFLANAPFLVGVIPAMVQLSRAYGSDKLGGQYAGLHKANGKALSGNFAAAIQGYQAILERVPHAAGVHYNLGMALLKRNEMDRAAEAFRLSLADCGNYTPSAHTLADIYRHQGRTDELAELEAIWNGPEGGDDVETPPDFGEAANPFVEEVPGMPPPQANLPPQQQPGSPFASDPNYGQSPFGPPRN